MKRRHFLSGLFGIASVPLLHSALSRADNAAPATKVERITRTEDEWRQLLTPQQFDVLRRDGTEQPWSSPLNDEKRDGVYVCAGCDLALFTSDTKYDSGTGWPSFYAPIAGALGTKRDFKMIIPRTEYHCARCEGHQGHVFKDGPPPTGERWCNNGVALRFIAATS
jgi:peptide-methionine (R)-S-oxide reductase